MKYLLVLLGLTAAIAGTPAISNSQEQQEQQEQQATYQTGTIYLLLRYGSTSPTAIPMKNTTECEMQGAVYMASKRMSPVITKWPHGDYRGFECLEGR